MRPGAAGCTAEQAPADRLLCAGRGLLRRAAAAAWLRAGQGRPRSTGPCRIEETAMFWFAFFVLIGALLAGLVSFA